MSFWAIAPYIKGVDVNLHPPSERVYISRHVVFNETVFPFAKPANLYVVQDAHMEISRFSDL